MYDAGSNLTFTAEDDGNPAETYLRVSLFEEDLTMFNNVFQVNSNTLGVVQTITYVDGDAIIRFLDLDGNPIDLDTLQMITLVIF